MRTAGRQALRGTVGGIVAAFMIAQLVHLLAHKRGSKVPPAAREHAGGPKDIFARPPGSRDAIRVEVLEWRKEIVQRVEHSFRDVYLQLISIVQGVAFGSLAATVVPASKSLRADEWLRVAVCCVVIVVIWHEYMIGSTMFAWTPTLLDAIIPFGLGAGEFGLVYTIAGQLSDFLVATLVTTTAGALAYVNYWHHARSGFPLNRLSYRLLRRHVRFGLAATTCSFVLVLVAFLVDRRTTLESYELLVTSAIAFPIVAMALHSIRSWNRSLSGLLREPAE